MRREVWLLSFLSRPKEGNDRQNAGREDAEQIDIDTGRWQGEGVDGQSRDQGSGVRDEGLAS